MRALMVRRGSPVIPVTAAQTAAIDEVREKVRSGHYHFVERTCLCGETKDDVRITDQDRYGFPVESMLCKGCGIIRSISIFDDESNQEFYECEYRRVYVGSAAPPLSFFEEQVKRGEALLSLLRDTTKERNFRSVMEVGCGAGGILYPFSKSGAECVGFDYDSEYLDYGRKKGLGLVYGDYANAVAKESMDVVILSHVLEHFAEPARELIPILERLAPGGYLVVQVPGIFSIHRSYRDPFWYFQNAHVFNFHKAFLTRFFEAMSLRVLYGDEFCSFVVQKPQGWSTDMISSVDTSELHVVSRQILRYLSILEFLYAARLRSMRPKAMLLKLLLPLCRW